MTIKIINTLFMKEWNHKKKESGMATAQATTMTEKLKRKSDLTCTVSIWDAPKSWLPPHRPWNGQAACCNLTLLSVSITPAATAQQDPAPRQSLCTAGHCPRILHLFWGQLNHLFHFGFKYLWTQISVSMGSLLATRLKLQSAVFQSPASSPASSPSYYFT